MATGEGPTKARPVKAVRKKPGISEGTRSANQKKTLAEARQAQANADKAEMEAAILRISLEREQDKRRREMASNENHHLFHFTSDVSAQSVAKCMDQLAVWRRNEPKCPIEIVFTSPGGDVVAGMALFDYIQELRHAGHFVTTSTIGYAASMAGILLQAGDKRVMGKEAWILIHQTSFGAVGSYGEVEDRIEWVKRLQKRIVKIFAERSNLSEEEIEERWKRTDWWVDSDGALEMGLVDEVR